MSSCGVTCVVCSTAATVYCDNDQAFLCKDCDCKIHSSNTVASRHFRVRVCELCNKHASTVYCKNDRAYLCDECDSEIHLNNPLAARHEIVPVAKALDQQDAKQELPAESAAVSEASAIRSFAPERSAQVVPKVPPAVELTTSKPIAKEQIKSYWGKEFEFFELDNAWLDRLDMGFDIPDILSETPSDGLVPTLSDVTEGSGDNVAVVPQLKPTNTTASAYATSRSAVATNTLAPTMPVQQAPMQFVPTQQTTLGSAVDSPNSSQVPQNFSVPPSTLHVGGQAPLNRAERVMRYREKRKLRKFEKTIRYASRKAYAEVRPRIKGRFAKREEVLAWKAGLLDPNHPLSIVMAQANSHDFESMLVPDMMS